MCVYTLFSPWKKYKLELEQLQFNCGLNSHFFKREKRERERERAREKKTLSCTPVPHLTRMQFLNTKMVQQLGSQWISRIKDTLCQLCAISIDQVTIGLKSLGRSVCWEGKWEKLRERKRKRNREKREKEQKEGGKKWKKDWPGLCVVGWCFQCLLLCPFVTLCV